MYHHEIALSDDPFEIKAELRELLDEPFGKIDELFPACADRGVVLTVSADKISFRRILRFTVVQGQIIESLDYSLVQFLISLSTQSHHHGPGFPVIPPEYWYGRCI